MELHIFCHSCSHSLHLYYFVHSMKMNHLSEVMNLLDFTVFTLQYHLRLWDMLFVWYGIQMFVEFVFYNFFCLPPFVDFVFTKYLLCTCDGISGS